MTTRVSDVLRVVYPGSLDHVEQHHLDRGTRLHLEMEIYFTNQQQGTSYTMSDGLTAQDQYRIWKMIEWCQSQQLVGYYIEQRYHHKYGFIGHPDFVGSWNGFIYVLDWKFADSISEQNEMQGEVYKEMTGHPAA